MSFISLIYPLFLNIQALPSSMKVLIPCGLNDALSKSPLMFNAWTLGFCSFRSIKKICPGSLGAKLGMPGYFSPCKKYKISSAYICFTIFHMGAQISKPNNNIQNSAFLLDFWDFSRCQLMPLSDLRDYQ